MAHLLPSTPPAPAAITALSARNRCSPRVVVLVACSNQCSKPHINVAIDRRSVALGLAGAILGLEDLLVGDESANAAARRPPPGPPAEKKDPNISGLTAKILASKKRKEAMKEAIAKQRQLGKPAAKQD